MILKNISIMRQIKIVNMTEDFMKNLKVALIQYDTVMPDIEQNTITAIKLIREASKNGADLVLFPECFLTAYASYSIHGINHT